MFLSFIDLLECRIAGSYVMIPPCYYRSRGKKVRGESSRLDDASDFTLVLCICDEQAPEGEVLQRLCFDSMWVVGARFHLRKKTGKGKGKGNSRRFDRRVVRSRPFFPSVQLWQDPKQEELGM